MFKVIIAGSRTFTDCEFAFPKLDHYLSAKEGIEVVSGGCRGGDAVGESWALLRWHNIKLFPADWKSYGSAAGPIRNRQMAQYADACIVFWDGESRGTANMIEEAKTSGIPVRVININN